MADLRARLTRLEALSEDQFGQLDTTRELLAALAERPADAEALADICR